MSINQHPSTAFLEAFEDNLNGRKENLPWKKI
jgi:hypothetical protein